jgi:hypothetical protein
MPVTFPFEIGPPVNRSSLSFVNERDRHRTD